MKACAVTSGEYSGNYMISSSGICSRVAIPRDCLLLFSSELFPGTPVACRRRGDPLPAGNRWRSRWSSSEKGPCATGRGFARGRAQAQDDTGDSGRDEAPEPVRVSGKFFGGSKRGRNSVQTMETKDSWEEPPALGQNVQLDIPAESRLDPALERSDSLLDYAAVTVDFQTALLEVDVALGSDDLAEALGRLRSLRPQGLDAVGDEDSAGIGVFQGRAAHLLDLALREGDMERVLEAYDWLKSCGVLPSFGRERNTLQNAEPRLVTPDVLKAFSGLTASQLSPKKWGTSNGLAPLLVVGTFAALVNNGIDVRPLALLCLILAALDSIFLGGAAQAQALSLWPGYKRRVLVHEAGHVVVAYLLGCPVRGVVLDAFLAMDLGIQGQAGTQFWDSTLDLEMRAGRLTGTTVDRYSAVLFAGIAAEALTYGEAEGGESDENLFKALAGTLQPQWSQAKVANQARWAVLQAHSILLRQRRALEAVVEALEKGASMGDVALAIEANIVR